jgi:hypothetical protein
MTSVSMRIASRALVAALAAGLACAACARLEPIRDCAGEGDIEVLCGFQNPEDLAAAPGGEWIVVSQLPRHLENAAAGSGSLLVLRPRDGERRVLFPVPGDSPPEREPGVGSPTCSGPPDPARFAPHGIDVAPGTSGAARLLVVNHGGREAIELFRLEPTPTGPAATWQGCVPLPDEAQANDVAALPGSGFVTTNMLPREPGVLDGLRVALGMETGELLEWSAEAGWRAVPGTRASAPNGVVASRDGKTLYFAAWGSSRLVRVQRDGSALSEVALPHHPDNLSWAPDGSLLVTGQKGSVLQIAACGRIESGTCPLPFSVVRVTPADLTFSVIFDHDPARLDGAGTVAIEHDGALWIGTFAGDRILRVVENP